MITLKTLPSATAQQVFDQIAVHLLTQKSKSFNVDLDACAYKVDGLMCAAGCLIADHEYKEEFEQVGWEGLVEHYDVPGCHARLIASLQAAHDCCEPYEWPERLKWIASQYQLNDVVLN